VSDKARDRCQFCGEFQSDNTEILRGYDICFDCISSLIDNEQERRGLAEQERRSREFYSGAPMAEDREREQLREAVRIP
jgi:hypothetical protein